MEILNYLFQGLIQGLTEFLPVSSSGHLALYSHFFGNPEAGGNQFTAVMLHIGTLVAVFIVYRKLIGELIMEFFHSVRDIFTGKFSFKNMSDIRRMLVMVIFSTSLLVFALPLSKLNMDEYLTKNIWLLGFCFMITGALLLTAYFLTKRRKNFHGNASAKDALAVGITQLIAVTPGISRSGSTVASGLICGLKREYMIQYTFILSIPAILAAAAKEGMDAMEAGIHVDWAPLIAGVLSSIVFGVIAIKLLNWIIKKDLYNYFGYYCGALGFLVIIVGIIEKANGVASLADLF